jgi:hypothetical protein
MPAPTRIYVAKNVGSDEVTFVQAVNPASVFRHLALKTWTVRPASALDIAEYYKSGGDKHYEVAGEEIEDQGE